MPEDKSAEVDVVAEKADEAQPMQPLGAEKAQRDSDAFFGTKDKEESGDKEAFGMNEKPEPAESDPGTKKPKAVFDDPFGDDPFADGPRRTDPMPDSQFLTQTKNHVVWRLKRPIQLCTQKADWQ